MAGKLCVLSVLNNFPVRRSNFLKYLLLSWQLCSDNKTSIHFLWTELASCFFPFLVFVPSKANRLLAVPSLTVSVLIHVSNWIVYCTEITNTYLYINTYFLLLVAFFSKIKGWVEEPK